MKKKGFLIREVESNLTWASFTSHKQYATFTTPIGVKLAFSFTQTELPLNLNGSKVKWTVLLILENLFLAFLSEGSAITLHYYVDFVPCLAALQDVWCAYLGTVNLLDWTDHFLLPDWWGVMRWHSGNEIRTEQCFPRVYSAWLMASTLLFNKYSVLYLLPQKTKITHN